MEELTAKDFQSPLLQALGELSSYKAGEPIHHAETYSVVMRLMGIEDSSALVENPTSQKPQVQQPRIQQLTQDACKNLRKQDLIVLRGRGLWTLTSRGLAKVVELRMPDVPPESQEEVSDIPEPTVAIMSSEAFNDPYIQSLLIQQAPCFGHFTSHQGSGCKDCLIHSECQGQQSTAWGACAKKYAETPLAVEGLSETPEMKATSLETSSLDLKGARTLVAFEDIVCGFCGLVILKDYQCFWVDNVVTDTAMTLHQGCMAELIS